ncbi:MAG: hypothetical protein ACFFAH_14790, partial [Promethearchaeota archaeon]
IRLNHFLAILQQKMRDIKPDIKDFFTKRKAMKRRYYDEVLVLIKNKLFKEAANKYLELIKILLKRKDYENSSLLLLLYGLSMLKGGESPEQIKTRFLNFLEKIGLSKEIFKETFYFTLLLFIIDVKLHKLKDYNANIKKFLKLLPIFEEEKELTNITE